MAHNSSFMGFFLFLYYVLILVVSITIGLFFVIILAAIPSSVRLSADIPINPLILATTKLSAIMILKLFRSTRFLKNGVAHAGIIILYSIVIWATSTETSENVTFNTQIMSYLTYLICGIAIMPILGLNYFINYEKQSVRNSIFLPTSTMWLSPLLAEMYIWAKWFALGIFREKASYMTLGGAGTQDILFWYGFLALVITTSFHLLRIITFPIFEKYIYVRISNLTKK